MSMTHCNCDADAPRSARMLGMATLTIVASIDTISRLRQQDTKMMALRRLLIDRTTVSFTQLLLNYNCPPRKAPECDVRRSASVRKLAMSAACRPQTRTLAEKRLRLAA